MKGIGRDNRDNSVPAHLWLMILLTILQSNDIDILSEIYWIKRNEKVITGRQHWYNKRQFWPVRCLVISFCEWKLISKKFPCWNQCYLTSIFKTSGWFELQLSTNQRPHYNLCQLTWVLEWDLFLVIQDPELVRVRFYARHILLCILGIDMCRDAWEIKLSREFLAC